MQNNYYLTKMNTNSSLELGITVWGNDKYTSKKDGLDDEEQFSIRLWNNDLGYETVYYFEAWEQGNGYYTHNGIAIAGQLRKGKSLDFEDFGLFQNCPNPFSQSTNLNYYIHTTAWIDLDIFAATGEKIMNVVSAYKERGYYTINCDFHNHTPGLYYAKLSTGRDTKTIPLLLIK